MKNITITTLSLIAFVGGILLVYRSYPAKQNPSGVVQTAQQTNSVQKWETKTEEQASVTVVVTPLDLSPQSAEWKFDIGMNTHAVELDQDMTKIAILVDDQGKEYKPLAWEGPTGGHHREGTLTFARITPAPKSITLKISGVGEVDRSFSWNL